MRIDHDEELRREIEDLMSRWMRLERDVAEQYRFWQFAESASLGHGVDTIAELPTVIRELLDDGSRGLYRKRNWTRSVQTWRD